jgi:hypothetical protein
MKKKFLNAFGAFAIAATIAVPSASASATVPGTGAIHFGGWIKLQAFPTGGAPLATSSNTFCANGVVNSGLVGPCVPNPLCTPSNTACPLPNPLTAYNMRVNVGTTYSEPCPAVIGSASGTVTITTASAPNTKAFSWTRVGLVAVILIGPTPGPVTVSNFTGAGAAVLVPSLVQDSGPGDLDEGNVTGCPPPNDDLWVFIAGAAAWTA